MSDAGIGGAGGSIDAGVDTGGPSGTSKTVFVSSVLTADAKFGSLAAADALCQSLADGATLGGTWKAWLSDQREWPATRFTHAAVPYRLRDGTIVANDWAALTSGTLAHAIDHDETGALATGVTEVWTGTNPDGTYEGDSCKNWTSNGPNPFVGSVGLFDSTDSTWTNVYLQFCDRTMLRVYCFEQ
jgi:hypothetical protein